MARVKNCFLEQIKGMQCMYILHCLHRNFLLLKDWIRVSSVGTEIRLRAGKSGVRIPGAVRDYLPRNYRTGSETYQPQTVQSIPGCLPRGKSAGAEVDHSLPSVTEVKSEWSYTSAPRICLRGVDRENFVLQKYGRKDSKKKGEK